MTNLADAYDPDMTLDWVGIVERDGAALGDAAAQDLAAPIAAVPEWDTTELLRHIGMIHSRVAVVLRTGTMERPTVENGMLAPPPETDHLRWYRATLADLLTQLRAIDDPDRPVYSFARDHQRAEFWPRRMAHETAVHRFDAEQAVGRATGPIAPEFAVDGIDELFSIFVASFAGSRSPGDGRTVHVHATDAQGEWLIRFESGAVVVESGHAKGDAAVRGRAADLYLWLWGRVPLDRLEVLGDPAAAEALRTVTRF